MKQQSEGAAVLLWQLRGPSRGQVGASAREEARKGGREIEEGSDGV